MASALMHHHGNQRELLLLCRWSTQVTHVVLPAMVRTVKSLAAMASGRWILHTDFVEACASAESWVEPVCFT